jgi:hypothetical protein
MVSVPAQLRKTFLSLALARDDLMKKNSALSNFTNLGKL